MSYCECFWRVCFLVKFRVRKSMLRLQYQSPTADSRDHLVTNGVRDLTAMMRHFRIWLKFIHVYFMNILLRNCNYFFYFWLLITPTKNYAREFHKNEYLPYGIDLNKASFRIATALVLAEVNCINEAIARVNEVNSVLIQKFFVIPH